MMEDNQRKKQIIDELVQLIEQKGRELQASDLPAKDQLPQVDVLLDTIRFLDQYDTNVQVLNRYWREQHWKDKFSKHKEDRE